MSVSLPTEPDGESVSVTELVSGIVGDVQDLGMQHLALFRNEIKKDLQRTTDAMSSIATGLAIVQIGGFMICMMIALLISRVVPDIPPWLSYGIVGCIVLASGARTIFAGLRKLQSIDTLSQQAAYAMEEDAKWLTKPK